MLYRIALKYLSTYPLNQKLLLSCASVYCPFNPWLNTSHILIFLFFPHVLYKISKYMKLWVLSAAYPGVFSVAIHRIYREEMLYRIVRRYFIAHFQLSNISICKIFRSNESKQWFSSEITLLCNYWEILFLLHSLIHSSIYLFIKIMRDGHSWQSAK